jgi:hypothetical protein
MRIVRPLYAIIAAGTLAAAPLTASAQVSVGVAVGFGGPGWGVGIGYSNYAPPALPVYYQPAAPYPSWQWIPGYWAYGSGGYYWVPGYWTAPPAVGYYWTPGYWGYLNGGYVWNAGYWGPAVGFYGGIDYGFGYFGLGFVGGYWSGGIFNYNTAVVNVNRTVIHNTYVDPRVVHRATLTHSRVSYNGGRGGIHATPTRAQLAARRGARAQTAAQRAHERLAAARHARLVAARHRANVAAHRANVAARHARVAAHHASVAAHRASVAAAHHNASVTSAYHHAPVLTTRHCNAMTYHNPAPVAHQQPRPPGGAFGAHPAGGRPPGHG